MDTDVIILGGGLVGATLALALAKHGLTACVVDPADPAVTLAPGFDGRASAVASASGRMLDAIGLGEVLAGRGCPIHAIRVSDGLLPGALDFVPDADDGALGVMYENRLLRRTLFEAASAEPRIELRMQTRAVAVDRTGPAVVATLSDGSIARAALLVAAEGRNSPSREAAGIKVARWKYDHAAIVGAFHHERPHGNVAFEIFYPAGPFALLPLLDDEQGHRSAIVWTVDAAAGPAMLKLSDRAFLHEAEKRMGGLLGALSGASPRATYPLGFHHAARITAERLALVGDAAHGIHPIAGQGLNLGFRDVAALAEVLVEGKRLGLDLGDAQLLARYERWRGLDTFAVAFATDSLTRLFGIPGRTASAVRRFGISAVNAIPPLKDRFMAEARGESGALPKLLQGNGLINDLRALPPGGAAATIGAIDALLVAVARDHHVTIPLAIESGSRAWGFPSPDSDYDCRFLFVRRLDHYLTPWPPRDVIETPLVGDLDVNGWDLGKALTLMLKGNAVVLEWLQSPYRYAGDSWFRDRMLDLAFRHADRAAIARHYLHLGWRQRRTYFPDDDDVPLKKLFYALRPAAALRWLRLHEAVIPPMHFPTLMAECDPPSDVMEVAAALLDAKARTRELGMAPLPEPIGRFIDEEFADARERWPKSQPDRAARGEAALFFREAVRRYDTG